MGKEHRGIKSIYKDYEDWEIETYEPHEPIKGNPNRRLSIERGMFMYIDRTYHNWLHVTEEGQIKDKEYKEEMQLLCMEAYNMSIDEFRSLFGKNYIGG